MARRKWVDIRSKGQASDLPLLTRVRWGASFFWRLRGMMFRRGIEPGEAIVLVEARDSRAAVTIHMFFVPFTLAVIWIDHNGRVVDKVAAKPWRPFYAPRAPARFILETHPEFLDRVSIGDDFVFEDCPTSAVSAEAGRAAAQHR